MKVIWTIAALCVIVAFLFSAWFILQTRHNILEGADEFNASLEKDIQRQQQTQQPANPFAPSGR